nr:MAG TPA: hypothetical protein [Caudoviricetes sp.]
MLIQRISHYAYQIDLSKNYQAYQSYQIYKDS